MKTIVTATTQLFQVIMQVFFLMKNGPIDMKIKCGPLTFIMYFLKSFNWFGGKTNWNRSPKS